MPADNRTSNYSFKKPYEGNNLSDDVSRIVEAFDAIDAQLKATNDAAAGLASSKQNNLGFTAENAENKGAANGYASLDSGGKVPTAQIPSYYDDRTIQVLGTVTGAVAIALGSGTNATLTLGGAITVNVSGLTPGKVSTVTLLITNPGAFAITWPTGTVFNRAVAPTLPAIGKTLIVLETYNNGASWSGIQVWRDVA